MLLPKRCIRMFKIIDSLNNFGDAESGELLALISQDDPEANEYLRSLAEEKRKSVYSNHVYIRGLIEVSNICKNDCLYCGIRGSNRSCSRYRLTEEEIMDSAESGYGLGFRTFVMQGGEDGSFDDVFLCRIIGRLKEKYPDCAVTLSLGERSRESYKRLYDAGADRYLLRHETANREHYGKLHPANMSFDTRMKCLHDLKDIGFQTGCGMMVGSPYQTAENIVEDLKFIKEFSPEMCGIGPFIPHKDTPFGDFPMGSTALTLKLLSIIRLMLPSVLLPSTTALNTALPNGRELGILAGANVIMPNLSPVNVREKYELYNGKLHSGKESAQLVNELKMQMENIGYRVVTDRGDFIKSK